MQHPYDAIIKFFRQHSVEFEEINHEPVYTSEQAASIRGMSLRQGAKSLLLKAGNEFVLVILPGDKRLDSRKVKAVFATKDLRFASPTEVKEVMGCDIGACYPFGNLLGIKMVVDPTMGDNDEITFNPGVHNKSITMKWEEYNRAVNPVVKDVIVNNQ